MAKSLYLQTSRSNQIKKNSENSLKVEEFASSLPWVLLFWIWVCFMIFY